MSEGELRRAVITYEGLPLSSGGAHSLGRLDPMTVWIRLGAFMDACATGVRMTARIELFDQSSAGERLAASLGLVQRSVHRQVKSSATSSFGKPRRGIAVEAVEPGEGLRGVYWMLQESDVIPAIEWMKSQPSQPDTFIGPALVVSVEGPFRLRHPRSGDELPHQDPAAYGDFDFTGWGHLLGQSGLRARLGSYSTCSIVLSLPFEEATPELLGYVQVLQGYLPFKLSSKHWTRWQLNKGGNGYHGRKIDLTLGAST